MSARDARLLRRAADLVRLGWCQGAIAVADSGAEVSTDDPLAVRWSMQGALARAWQEAGGQDERMVSLAVFQHLQPGDWQDEPGRTAEEVARHLEAVAAWAERA